MQDNQYPTAADEDRRQFFRVEDAVHVSLRPVPAGDLEKRLRQLHSGTTDIFSLMTGLNAIAQQMTVSLRRIESESPDIGEYLKALDRKIDLLARAFLAEEANLNDKPVCPVNLSAGGMAVQSEQPHPVGTVLEVKLLLLPSYAGILSYGTVVSSEPTVESAALPYRLRVEFSHIRDADRDALIRHVLKRQGEELRNRRRSRAPG